MSAASGDGAREALDALRALTTCQCHADFTVRGRHETHCASHYREDVDTLAGFLAAVSPAAPTAPGVTQADVLAWLNHNFGPVRSVQDQALVLAEETGELCRAIVKRQQGIRGSHAVWSAELRKEAADVGLALLAIAGTEGFDFPTAMAERWAVVSERDFKADPNGNGPPAPAAGGSPAPDGEDDSTPLGRLRIFVAHADRLRVGKQARAWIVGHDCSVHMADLRALAKTRDSLVDALAEAVERLSDRIYAEATVASRSGQAERLERIALDLDALLSAPGVTRSEEPGDG